MSITERRDIDLAKRIKEFALLHGVDLIGIAPVSRFNGAPTGFHPRDIMAEANSVIVIGIRVPIGVLEGKSRGAYTKANQTIFDKLDRCAYELSIFIEKLGGRANFIPADPPHEKERWDTIKQEGRGELSHRHAAVLAGLGSLGKNTLLLTSDFGSRVNLASILTDLHLSSDRLFENELCITDCKRCIEVCPAKAFRGDGTVNQKQCRKFETITTPRGFKLYACWECRRVCPVGKKLITT